MAHYETSIKRVPTEKPDKDKPLTRDELRAISVALIVLRDRHIASKYRAGVGSQAYIHNDQASTYLNDLRYKVDSQIVSYLEPLLDQILGDKA
jgi:hypothetical protein